MASDKRETVRRLMAVALDERAPMTERTAMALQAVKLIDKHRLLDSTAGLPTSVADAVRTWQSTAKAYSRPVYAEPVRTNGKGWKIEEPVEVLEETDTVVHLKGKEWSQWLPRSAVVEWKTLGISGHVEVTLDYRVARMFHVTERSKGAVVDV